jgi:hypothetical protein
MGSDPGRRRDLRRGRRPSRSDIGPLPESDDEAEVVGFDDMNDDDTMPGVTGEVPMIAEPLPEMDAEIWQAGIQAVVSVSDDTPPVWPTAEEWASEARRYRTESALADGPVEAARLLVAAARAFEQPATPTRPPASMTRLCRMTRTCRRRCARARGSPRAAASSTTRTRCGRACPPRWKPPTIAASTARLSAEWTLARGGRLPPIARQAIPAGPARALAQAEEALRAGATGDLAAALAEAGRGHGRRAGRGAARTCGTLPRGGARSSRRGRRAGRRREAGSVRADVDGGAPAGRRARRRSGRAGVARRDLVRAGRDAVDGPRALERRAGEPQRRQAARRGAA